MVHARDTYAFNEHGLDRYMYHVHLIFYFIIIRSGLHTPAVALRFYFQLLIVSFQDSVDFFSQ
jgi:hypothetical protein